MACIVSIPNKLIDISVYANIRGGAVKKVSFSELIYRWKIYNQQKFKHLTETQLYEFKVDDGRLLSFFAIGRKIIITHGFSKKARKTPRCEIIRAEIIRAEFLERMMGNECKELG